ncbi:Phage capsid family protein [Aquimixticola soesokkakensis]|uniref:Phage capsid family protein n=1 Tax=Aquimixticola soesokkakensis TaxID=1519096 RepID=A0A1Y5SFQ5_9RHOB|nr:phage major capsid protein [Aquimixticola soesokkakensis]SLN36636.1 Phage capsid family protein [Aquimixticola soesokkakensis]
MTLHFPAPRARGIVSVRADMSDPKAILAELQKTFEAFKAENDAEIKALKKGQQDVVQTEKVDRINAEITSLNKAMDEANAMLAALKAGGIGSDVADPAAREHAEVFSKWFRKGDRAIADADLGELEVKASLTTESNPDGGYLVPEEMATTIDRVAGTVSVMRELASVMSISSGTYKKLVNMGGAGAGWVGEKQARTETDTPTLRELIFNVMELYANPAATQMMLDDARVDIAEWLGSEVAITFAEQEGAAFVAGDGVLKPRGLLSYTNVANASYAWGKLGYTPTGVASALTDATHNGADAMIELYYSLKEQYRNGATWLTSDVVAGTMRKFKDGDGTYLWGNPTAAGETPTFLGKPVRTDDNMQAVGAGKFPTAFGNFKRGYLIVDRFGIRVLRDPYTNKPYVHFYTTKRVGGGVQNFEAIKLLKVAAS